MTKKTCLTAVLEIVRWLCTKPELRRSFASLSRDYIMPPLGEQNVGRKSCHHNHAP